MSLLRTEYVSLLRNDLYAFVVRAFAQLNPGVAFLPNWHVELIAAAIQRAINRGVTRLIVNIPPRHLKSLIASVAAPAFLLGQDPTARILSVSYSQDLAYSLAQQSRMLFNTPWYQQAFGTRLALWKNAVGEFHTRDGGYRLSASVGGPLTGFGADYIIIDDPIKPEDALSDKLRTGVNDWFGNTLYSRLNDKRRSVIIVIMQRLHEDDLVGHILKQEPWEVISLPAIAEFDEEFVIDTPLGQRRFTRSKGGILHPERESAETLAHLRKTLGEYDFAAQYQQSPAPLGGGYIKEKWFQRYDPMRPPSFMRIVQSWDTANKPSELADYCVCTTWGIVDGKMYLLDVYRARLDFPQLKQAVKALNERFHPTEILIEDKASGTQLAQELRYERMWNVQSFAPKGDKVMRMMAQTPLIESGRAFIPERAPWLDAYLHELQLFPKGRYDDQVDSTSQALEFIKDIKPETGSQAFYRIENEKRQLAAAKWNASSKDR